MVMPNTRLHGTWVEQQTSTDTDLGVGGTSATYNRIIAALGYANVVGFSHRVTWAKIYGTGPTYPYLQRGLDLVRQYNRDHNRHLLYAPRLMAGTNSPAAVTANGAFTTTLAGKDLPLPFNTSGAVNTVFESALFAEFDGLAAWCRANGVVLLHATWYSGLWAELYLGPAIVGGSQLGVTYPVCPQWSALGAAAAYNLWVAAHNRITDHAYGLRGDDLTWEFPLSGWSNYGQPASDLAAHINAKFGTNTRRVFVQANNYADDSPSAGDSWANTYSAKQMVGMDNDSTSSPYDWSKVYSGLVSSSSDYVEIYAESFAAGYGSTNTDELRAQITSFAATAPTPHTLTPAVAFATAPKAGVAVVGQVGTFDDTSHRDVASAYAAAIAWGDPDDTRSLCTVSGTGPFVVSAPSGADAFAYAKGTATATLVVTYHGTATGQGGQALATGDVVVGDPAPSTAAGFHFPLAPWRAVIDFIVCNTAWYELQPKPFEPLAGVYRAGQQPGQGTNSFEKALAVVKGFNTTYAKLAAPLTAGVSTQLQLVAAGGAVTYAADAPWSPQDFPGAHSTGGVDDSADFDVVVDGETMTVTGGHGTALLTLAAPVAAGHAATAKVYIAPAYHKSLRWRIYTGIRSPSLTGAQNDLSAGPPNPVADMTVTLGAAGAGGATGTSWPISRPTGLTLPPVPFDLTVQSEQVTVTAAPATGNWTVTRHVNGTTAAAHAGGTVCFVFKRMGAKWIDPSVGTAPIGYVPRSWTRNFRLAIQDLLARAAAAYDGEPLLLEVSVSPACTNNVEPAVKQNTSLTNRQTIAACNLDPGDLGVGYLGQTVVPGGGGTIDTADLNTVLNGFADVKAAWSTTNLFIPGAPYQGWNSGATAGSPPAVAAAGSATTMHWLWGTAAASMRTVLGQRAVIGNTNARDNLSDSLARAAPAGYRSPSSTSDPPKTWGADYDALHMFIASLAGGLGPPIAYATAENRNLNNSGTEPTQTTSMLNILNQLVDPTWSTAAATANGDKPSKVNSVEMPTKYDLASTPAWQISPAVMAQFRALMSGNPVT